MEIKHTLICKIHALRSNNGATFEEAMHSIKNYRRKTVSELLAILKQTKKTLA
jgi:hypothetical protein